MQEADDGDVIFIASGVYEEHINVLKSVEVIGTGAVIIRPIGRFQKSLRNSAINSP